MVAKLSGGSSIVSGVDKSQVPSLCRLGHAALS